MMFAGAIAVLAFVAAPDRPEPAAPRLDLQDCIARALAHNREIRTAALELERVRGDRQIEGARLSPNLEAITALKQAETRSANSSQPPKYDTSLRWTQRLLEFGRDAASLVNLRASQRAAHFGLEDARASVVSKVRETFYLIVNRQAQIDRRRDNLRNFQATLDRVRERFAQGLVLKADVLTAELSVREEELRINNLQRQHFRQKMDLLELLALPIGVAVEFVGELEAFELPVERAVELALENSSQVQVKREELSEQRRTLRQIRAAYFPDLAASAGLDNRENQLKATLASASQRWGLDLSGEHFIDKPETRFRQFRGQGDDYDWFLSLNVVLPLHDGGKRRGETRREGARLSQAGLALDDARAELELAVRKAYQDFLEAREELRIQQQTLAIAEERLSIQTELREYGRISDDELENFRRRFFIEQDNTFRLQDNLIRQQERLRLLMRHFR